MNVEKVKKVITGILRIKKINKIIYTQIFIRISNFLLSLNFLKFFRFGT